MQQEQDQGKEDCADDQVPTLSPKRLLRKIEKVDVVTFSLRAALWVARTVRHTSTRKRMKRNGRNRKQHMFGRHLAHQPVRPLAEVRSDGQVAMVEHLPTSSNSHGHGRLVSSVLSLTLGLVLRVRGKTAL